MTGYDGRTGRAELFEYWAHAASLVPVELQPLLRWRMARAHVEPWPGIRRIAEENPALLDDMYRAGGQVRARSAAATPASRARRRGPGTCGTGTIGKIALEYLFYEGRITTAKRVNFERFYDLTERVLPADVLAAPTPEPADAMRELVRISARAHGVATEPDLRDYFRLVARRHEARGGRARREPASSSRSRSRAGPRPATSGTRRAGPGGSRRGPCSRRSTRWSGTASAPSGSSASTTASRSTRRRRSASTATTCCRSCWGRSSSAGSTSSPTGRPACCACRARGSSRATTRGYVAGELAAELASTARWLGLDGLEVMPRGDLAADARRRGGLTPVRQRRGTAARRRCRCAPGR